MKPLLPYVPSRCDTPDKFKWRMKYYANHVAGNTLENVRLLATPLASLAEIGTQGPGNTPSHHSTNPITPSLRNVGFSDASTNMRLDVSEEGLDHPSYYGPR